MGLRHRPTDCNDQSLWWKLQKTGKPEMVLKMERAKLKVPADVDFRDCPAADLPLASNGLSV